MMTIIQKWRVVVKNPMTDKMDITIYIYDNHFSNVLRKLSEIDFDFEAYGMDIRKIN